MNTRIRSILFALLFLAWLPLGVVIVNYLPTTEAAEKYLEFVKYLATDLDDQAQEEAGIDADTLLTPENISETTTRLQVAWTIKLLLFLFGLVSVFYAWKRYAGWGFMLIAASAAYLVLGYSPSWSQIHHYDYWLMLWQMAVKYDIWSPGGVYRELLFPLFHVVFIIVLIARLAAQRLR